MRKILIKVWQGLLTPRQALRDLRRIGAVLGPNEERGVMDLLLALQERQITVTEAEQGLREEGVEYGDENSCQI